jgi:cytidyltransferase-like protein
MCADLFHYGHVNQLRNCRELCGPNNKVIVGIHSDEVIASYKRAPVMTMKERIAVVESCKYVDLVIPNAPLTLTEEYINKHHITTLIVSDQRTESEMKLMYAVPLKLGIITITPHTNTISTTDIIGRISKKKVNFN